MKITNFNIIGCYSSLFSENKKGSQNFKICITVIGRRSAAEKVETKNTGLIFSTIIKQYTFREYSKLYLCDSYYLRKK